VVIRLSPRSRTDRVVGIVPTTGSGRALKAAVSAAPEGGRANEALLQLLARSWDVPRNDLSIIQGSASRNKIVAIAGDPRRLIKKITAAVSGLPGS
jgi:uncharacterized protein YggU (UPF0235/DUF167 family)